MSSARNHQKRSHRSYHVTKSICGGVARKAWVSRSRLIRGRAQRTADRKRAEKRTERQHREG